MLSTGTHDHGQGHWTSFAQVVSERLGIPFASIRLMQTDSDALPAGGGTGGSKSLMASGAAFAEATDMVIERRKRAAAHVLEASAADIEFADGMLTIAGTDRGIGLIDLARKLAEASSLPTACRRRSTSATCTSRRPRPIPTAAHLRGRDRPRHRPRGSRALYEVNDFGVLVNPLIVAGQVQGGVVQGIGQCFMERTVYDGDGQLASGSFTDYAMPRAETPRRSKFFSHPVPARTNPLGVKGCGEAGCAGSLTSVMNAVTDALARHGVPAVDMPATPLRLFEAIRAARQA